MGASLRGWRSVLFCGVIAAACESSAPAPTDAGGDAGGAADVIDAGGDAGGAADVIDAGGDAGGACAPLATDYVPRSRMPATPAWPVCVSDDGAFHPNSTSIGSVSRTLAFEQMHRDPAMGRPDGLFDPTRDPSAEEFTAARLIYAQDNGLGSRVERRADEHYPQPRPNDCQMEVVRAANPDYCVGPSRLLPVLNAAFAAGQMGGMGVAQRVHAARIEAALLWFLYVSPFKESLTCTTTPADCDSAWAYYTAGQYERDGAAQYALARYVRALDPATHQRIWDGLLAVRCWQSALGMDLEARDRARAQLDRALTRGIVRVLQDRALRVASTTGAERAAHFAFVKVIGPLMDRAARAVDPAGADALRAAFMGEDPAAFPAERVVSTLERLFPCP